MARRLQLNFSPLRVHGTALRAYTMAYLGRDQLPDLRNRYRGEFAFARKGEQIFALPLKDEHAKLGEKKTLSVSEHSFLLRPLLEDRLVSLLSTNGRLVAHYNPITAVGRQILTGFPRLDEHLHVQSRVLIDVRSMKLQEGRAVGLLWDLEIQKSCASPLSVLREAALNIVGLVVEIMLPVEDPRMLPRRRLLGRVGSVSDQLAVLDERVPAVEPQQPLSNLYLEASLENVRRLVHHFAGNSAAQAFRKIDGIVFENSRGSARQQHIRNVSTWMRGLGPIELQPGLTVSIDELINETTPDRFPRFVAAPSATYVFDAGTEKSSTRASAGLNKFGPYSRHVFTPTKPNVCVVCEKSRRGQVEQFLGKFRDGMTITGPYQPFEYGFLRIYGLQGINFTFFEAESFSADAYWEAASKAVRAGADGAQWNLAIVQTERESKLLTPSANPYLVAKAAFLANQIPTQSVAYETLAMATSSLAYAISNMALAVYAKLGGVPWLIKSDRGIAHEVVIGLGSAAIGESRFSRRERIVGITSVFRGDGGYLLSNLSDAVPFERYGSALSSSLKTTLERVRAEMNWIKGDSVRVVIHAFKPMKNIEVDAVKASLRPFSDFDIQFAFLHVKERHPYLLFDDGSAGVKGRGEKTPVRGLFAELWENETLLTLTGPAELKRSTDGVPRPLLLSLHRDSTFNDLVYLTKQVYWFSSHSWRSFLPAGMPVTIFYSDLVAGLLGRLDRLGNRWSRSAMLGIGTSRWFL